MATRKERKWFQSEECKSVPLTLDASKSNAKSWRSNWASSEDSKPAVKPPRKILRLGQNDADLNTRSTSETNKPKTDNIIWKVRNTSKPNSCNPAPCSVMVREDMQEEKVLPHRKPENKKIIPKKDELKSSTICTEELKNIDGMRTNLQEDIRKVITKCPDKRKFDDIKNKSNNLSIKRGSGFSDDCQNLKKQYFSSVGSTFLNELKSNQKDNIPKSLMANQTIVKNSNTENKVNSKNSSEFSLHPSLRKNNNEKKMADYFLLKNNLLKDTEPKNEKYDCEEMADHKQNKFHFNVSSDSKNIRTSGISKNNQNDVFKDSPPTKNRNFYANFETLTDEDLEDFVENFKRFLQTKIISPQYMNSELSYNSNIRCFGCCYQEHSKEEPNKSNEILEGLCSHAKKSTHEKNSLINPINFNEINVIATVRVVNSDCDINDKELNLELCSKEEREIVDEQKEGSVLSFKETTLSKLNIEKSNFTQRNPIEYKDSRDLTVPFVYDDKKLIKPYNQCENKTTNSFLIYRGNFSEFVPTMERDVTPPLPFRNIQQKFNLKMLSRHFKGTCSKLSIPDSLVILKQFYIQQDECKTMSNFITTQFISKCFANSILSARNRLSFLTKQEILSRQLRNENEILTKDLKENKYRKINQPTKKETNIKVDPINTHKKTLTLRNVFCNNDDNSTEKTLNLKNQPHKKDTEAIKKENYIKNDVSDKTANNCQVSDDPDQTSVYKKTLIKERKRNQQLSSKNISESKTTTTTASKYLTFDKDQEIYDYFPDNILLTENPSPGIILTTEGAGISQSPKNESISRELFDFDSPNFENSSLSLKEKQLIGSFSEGCDLQSTCSTPRTPLKMQGSDDELDNLVPAESLHVINNRFLSEMEADIFSQDRDIFLPETSSSESLSTTDEHTNDCMNDYVNVDSPVSSGRCSRVDSDDNIQSSSLEEEDDDDEEENVFSLQQTPADFVEDATRKIKHLDRSFETTGSSSSLADDQNEDDDDDDDSDSVLSLYAPSIASFLDENEENNSDIRVAKNVLSDQKDEDDEEEEKKEMIKAEGEEEMSVKTSVIIGEERLNSNMEAESLGTEGKNKQLSSSDIKQETFLNFAFSEECKNGKLNKAFEIFVLLKDLNNDSPENVSLLLRSCLSQSNNDMTFLLIPDLIQHKMLTPKIVHDIFNICASCPFKYEEKLWKLYETMMLLNLCPTLNSARILLHMYFEMGNWHKIWQILLNTILMEPLSAIPTAIYHGALNFVINDSSDQYLPQTAEWICILAVDDLWNIEPCLLYHLSVLFKTKEYPDAYWILHEHLQQINNVPEEIVFTEEVDEPHRNPEYISCLQNIREIQANKHWRQLSDIFIFIYENSQLNTCWFIQPIVEGFLKIDNFLMMVTSFTDFINITCCQLKKLAMENCSYPISGCRKHLVRMVGDLISFCYNNQRWSEGIRIISVFLKNRLEFDLKDHLDSIPHDFILLVLDISLHSEEPLKAISLLEGLGWFCELPPMQFLQNFQLNHWLKKNLKILIDQLSNLDKLPNGCRVFSLFLFIVQEEIDRWHINEKLSPFNPKKFPCINHAELMIVANKFIHQCLISENVKSAIYTYNTIKSLLPKINPCCYDIAIYRALLVAAHLGPRFPPCARDLYNLCARHLEIYPPQKLIQPPWTLEIVLHLTDIEMHLVIEDFLESLYDIVCDQSTTGKKITLADLHLCVMVRDDIVIDAFPNICYLRNVPVNKIELLQQAMFVLQTFVAPPLESKMNSQQTGLLVNPESLKHFMFFKDSQRRNQGLQFCPVPIKKGKQRFRGKGNPVPVRVPSMGQVDQNMSLKKSEQGPAPGPQSHHANCDICGKLCLSLAGLRSHLHKCANPILHPNNVMVNKTDRVCQFCGKICLSLAGLKNTYNLRGD